MNAFFELVNAGCRIVARGVSASTSLGVGRRKSSLGSEQFLDFAKRAACCLEARKEVTDGERQSPEADKMFQNGFGVTKNVVIASLCVRWNNAIVHGSFASSFWLIGLSGLRIKV